MAQEELCLDGEEWRDIAGYEGYQVSNLGRVRSLDRTVVCSSGPRRYSGKILKPRKHVNPYYYVTLSAHGKQHNKDVHRLVAETFLDNPDNLPCVDHIDFNPANNRVDNLRWVTQKENIQHSIHAGHININEQTKILLDPSVRMKSLEASCRPVIRSDGKRYASVSDAARDMKCSRGTIQNSIKNLYKGVVQGYRFKYA